MGVPVIYRKSGEGAIASYDFFDIAAGKGIVTFYGGSLSGSYILSNAPFYSHNVVTRNTSSAASGANIIADMDFDITFERPIVVDGNIFISTPMLIRNTAANQTEKAFIQVYVRKVSGGTETTIVQQSGALMSFAVNTGVNVEKTFLNVIDTPRTIFKSGDTFRVTVEAHRWSDLGGEAITLVGHDPKNRTLDTTQGDSNETWTKEVTNLLVQVPIKPDL